MKKLYIKFIILYSLLISIKAKLNINDIKEKNEKEIKKINEFILSYRINNNLFNETIKKLKNISYGNELFENEYDYLKNISKNNNNKLKLKDESLYHRLIPEMLFEYNKSISCFNLISAKAMAKDDTGNFVSTLLLICQNNSIIISDFLGNIYLTYETDYVINEIITFKEIDIAYFYLVTDNFTKIKKFILFHNIYLNNNNTNNNNNNSKNDLDTIKIQTYTEDFKREKIDSFSYELYDTYKQNIKSKKLTIIEEEDIQFSLNQTNNKNEYIISITPISIKGSYFLMVITNNYSVYKLNYRNLDVVYLSKIELNDKKNLSYNLMPISMNFLYVLFNKSEKGYFVTRYDNTSIFGKCNLFPENSTEKIKNYFFEEKSKTLYIISSHNKVYLSIPMLLPSADSLNKNSCKTILLCELNKIAKDVQKQDINNNFSITLLNKKLMITNDGINFDIVDITKVGEVDDTNKLQIKFFDLNKFIDKENNYSSVVMKDNKKYLLLKQINDNALILFIFYEKNAKIYKTEKQVFNFKVPIILVAFAVILVWNYIKNKNEDNGNEQNKFKNKFEE